MIDKEDSPNMHSLSTLKYRKKYQYAYFFITLFPISPISFQKNSQRLFP